MRIAVTGASGSVGTALLRALDGGDHTVVALARRRPDQMSPPYAAADWVTADLGAADAAEELSAVFEGADAVVHLAWAVQPTATEPDPSRTNLAGTAAVLDAAASAGVGHVVAASSVAAYRPSDDRWARVREDWPCGGSAANVYSRGKAALEDLLDAFTTERPSVRVARVRPCAVAQRDAGSELLRWALSPLLPPGVLGRRWLPVPLWRQLRVQIVHADDVAEAIRLILLRGATGAFNLAAEPVLTADDLAAIFGGFRLPLPREVVTTMSWATWRMGVQPLHPGWLRLADQAPLMDTGLAREKLGWQPRYSSAAALIDLVEGMRHGDGTASGPLRPIASTGRLPWRQIRWGHPSHRSQRARDLLDARPEWETR